MKDTYWYWHPDKRLERGGYWESRERRRERETRRVRVFGSRLTMPDKQFQQHAIRLREKRKEADSGPTQIP